MSMLASWGPSGLVLVEEFQASTYPEQAILIFTSWQAETNYVNYL